MAPRTRFTRPRFILFALTIGLFGQLPGMALLAWALAPSLGTGAWGVSVALCVAITVPLLARLGLGMTDRAERGAIGFGVVVFFAWWGASTVGGAALPLTWLGAHLLGASLARAAQGALAIGGVVSLAGVTVDRWVARLRRVAVPIDGLPSALHGYRIAHLSDLHVGGFTPPERLRRWVERINRLEVDLVAVTGDLITRGDLHLADVARELSLLRARDGVALCLGNHDYFGDVERFVALLEAAGIDVLRNRGRVLARGDLRLHLAGVDDTWTRRHDVPLAMAERPHGLTSIVLAHDPKLFEECVAHGATLVLSGHTHGGQVALPLFPRTFNLARLAYRRVAGHYRLGASHLYVSRGAGTTGPPIRIGAPSEIALLTLQRVA